MFLVLKGQFISVFIIRFILYGVQDFSKMGDVRKNLCLEKQVFLLKNGQLEVLESFIEFYIFWIYGYED